MKIPKFKPSKSFVDGIKIPSLVAKPKNSQVPGLGEAHRREVGEDPVFNVYLRGQKPKEISAWQHKVLDRLFAREELTAAIAEAVNKAFQPDDFDEDVQRDGVLPHLYLTSVILDDEHREVILALGSIALGHIDEHGGIVHLKNEQWEYADGDYLREYISKLDLEGAAQQANDLSPTIHDLCGRWIFDEEATAERFKKLNMSSEIKSAMSAYGGLYYEVSDDAVETFIMGKGRKQKIVRCDWKKREVELTLESADTEHPDVFGGKFHKDQLVMDDIVFCRVPLSDPPPASPWKAIDPSPLFGRWVNDAKATGLNMNFVVEITPENITVSMGAPLISERWIACHQNGSDFRFETRRINKRDGTELPGTVLLKVNGDRMQYGSWVVKRG